LDEELKLVDGDWELGVGGKQGQEALPYESISLEIFKF